MTTQSKGGTPIRSHSPEYYTALISGLIHKLNNVITVLTGQGGLLLLEPKLSKSVREPLEQMAKATQTLCKYLDATAMLTRQAALNVERLGLAKATAGLHLPEKIKLVCAPEPSPTYFLADPAKLKMVLEELCRNSREANASQVLITASALPEHCEIRVRDNGSGIKEEVSSRIFDPFFTTKRSQENIGLGLFRAKGEIARMDGTIEATSDGHSFTEFLIRLPEAPQLAPDGEQNRAKRVK